MYFPVMLFITLYKVFLTFESVHEFLKRKASEQYFYKVLFIILKKVVQSLVCFCKWNPDLWPFKYKLPSSTLLWCCYYAVQGGSYYGVCGWNPLGRDWSNEIDLQVLFYPYVQFIMLNVV